MFSLHIREVLTLVENYSKQTFKLMFLTNDQGSWEVNSGNSVGLPGAHGEEIVRAYCFFDESQMVFTGGEDGKVKAWRPGN